MMGNEGISVADALALRNGVGDGDGWGGNGAWWIIILILFFMFGGWNRNKEENTNPCCVPATAQGVNDAFNFNQLDNGIRGLANGLCDGFYAQNNAIKDLGFAMQNCCCETKQSIGNLGFEMAKGFCSVDKGIMQNAYQNQAGFTALGNQLASCCCDIERGQDGLKYEVAQATNSILVSNEKNTDRIINHLTQTEMERLRAELQAANFQLSQLSQTSNIVNQLMPVAKPAYITCSPYAAAFGNCGNTCGCC